MVKDDYWLKFRDNHLEIQFLGLNASLDFKCFNDGQKFYNFCIDK